MKKIKFTCSHCGAKLRVPTHLAGVSAPCPKCGQTVTAPDDVALAVEDVVPLRQSPNLTSSAVGSASILGERVPRAQQWERASSGAHASVASPSALPRSSFASTPAVSSAVSPVSNRLAAAPNSRQEAPNQVVVEEIYFEDPAPPVSTTTAPTPAVTSPQGQSPAAGIPMTSIPDSGPTAAASQPADIGTAFFGDSTLASTKTRVYLPQPGTSQDLHHPDDFLSPRIGQEGGDLPVVTHASELPLSRPTLQDYQTLAEEASRMAGGTIPSSTHEGYPSLGQVPHAESSTPTSPIFPEVYPTPHSDLFLGMPGGPEQAPTSEYVNWSPPVTTGSYSSPEWQTVQAADRSDGGKEHPSLTTMSSEFAPPPELPLATPLEALPANLPSGRATSGPPPLPTSSPALDPSNEPLSSLSAHLLPDDDETNFDDLVESKGISRSTWVMIVSIVAVALLMGIGMVFVIFPMLGGLSPSEAYREPDDASEAVATKKVDLPRVPKSTITESTPDLSDGDPKALVDPPAVRREVAPAKDPVAISFEEKVKKAVDESQSSSIIGSPSLDLTTSKPTDYTGMAATPSTPPAPAENSSAGESPSTTPSSSTPPPTSNTENPATPLAPTSLASTDTGMSALPAAAAGTAGASLLGEAAVAAEAKSTATKDPNYNPPDSFPAPSTNDTSLGKTHDLIDAFLRAPDAATRAKYTYHGDSLRPTIEDYYKKWPYRQIGRYSAQFFQLESDPELRGPFWVFIISTAGDDSSFPFIIREEGGNLKADWEIFSEFYDRHYIPFRDAAMPEPGTFRMVIERFTDYYGKDRAEFKDLDDYTIYQVNVPYGGEDEFNSYAFAKKGSEVQKALDKIVQLGEDPLAVMITLEKKTFPHGEKHYVITKLVSEGWFP